MSKKSDVHRDLDVVTPMLVGPDVKELQERLNHHCDHYRFSWRRTRADGEYGKRTQRCAQFAAWLIGLDDKRIEAIAGLGRITEEVQQLLRDPGKRSRQDREREDSRKGKREKLHKAHEEGPKAAVEWALKQVGTTETPPNSNRGPEIDKWSALFGFTAAPWCGIFVGYAVKQVGKANCDTRFASVAEIRADALAGRNNLQDINPSDAEPGDIATLFNGTDAHVGLIRSKSDNGKIFTVEGNTSSMMHDADGGIVETKEHAIGEVSCMVRVQDWG